MFDWNDEELANIIWGEDHKSDDHIVPYRDGSEEKSQVSFEDYNKKEWKDETSTIKNGLQASKEKTDIYSHFDTNGLSASEFNVGSWPNLSLTDAAKTNHDSRAETVQQDKDPEVFQNGVEDKDESDFLDYGWANIGSFDDLDRLVSHDDTIFGHESLGNADELWSSSKDLNNSPVKLFPFSVGSPTHGSESLKNASEHFEINTEFSGQKEQLFTSGHGKTPDATSQDQLNTQEFVDPVECGRDKDNKPMVKEQMALDMAGKTTASELIHAAENVSVPYDFEDEVSRQKKPPKCQEKAERNEEKLLQAFCGAWPPSGNQCQQLENHFTQSTIQACPPSVLNQQKHLERTNSLQYQQLTNSVFAPASENSKHQCSTIPGLPCIQFGEHKQPPMFPGYEDFPGHPSPLEESQNASVKPLTMTPREKIEKLRRRQQMQAMLSIKKQEEKFNHSISCGGHSSAQKCPQASQIPLIEGTSIKIEENLNTDPSLDSYSPVEQADSSKASLSFDDYSTEETIFNRLQDIIVKLDIRIRLCLRDSLFRLAQSAQQRHYAGDASSTNRASRDEHKVVIKEEINDHSRHSKMLEVETETNPIDRIVAHLLFHRPLDLSGKHPQIPESPVSSKLPCNHYLQNFCPQGTKALPPLTKLQPLDQLKDSPSMEASENASNDEFADGAMEIKGFQ